MLFHDHSKESIDLQILSLLLKQDGPKESRRGVSFTVIVIARKSAVLRPR